MKRKHLKIAKNYKFPRNKRKKRNVDGLVFIRYSLYLLVFSVLINCYEKHLYELTAITNLWENAEDSPEFRAMSLSENSIEALHRLQKEESFDIGKLITIWMLDNDYDLENCNFSSYKLEDFSKSYSKKEQKKKIRLDKLVEAYEVVWEDLQYFPVPISKTNEKATVTYENSWLAERTFGGTRGHEGTDIMAGINKRGYYPVVSMTNGTVEQVGWLRQGGWRIGIRAEHGAYFYYAHLYNYAKDFKAGDTVNAGEFLGYMGDSGYSDVVGTTGNFDVHLHIGIYIKTDHNKELSLNPYWVLRCLNENRLTYSY